MVLSTDAAAAAIHLKHPARRVACLSASGLDVLAELGLEPVGSSASEVASQPEFFGEQAAQWPHLGTWAWPRFPALRDLKPDLILAWSFPHRFYQRRLAAIAPTYSGVHIN
jgi:iron complex transport system substrate-binding protein